MNEPDLETASSFRNFETANRVVGKAIKENTIKIEKWLSGNSNFPLKLEITAESPIGIVLGRGKAGSVGLKTAVETNKAEIILVRDNTPNGWHILTSYPVK